jgi:bacillopeptidase F
MGIMVGGDASGEAIGVAPDAQWIAAKVFNDQGWGTLSRIHEAFQWILDPDGDPLTDDAPSIVVCPWGVSGTLDHCFPEFDGDIQALRAAGIAVVFPAGNDGPGVGTSSSPGNTPGALAVGAVDSGMVVAPFSSRGPSACGGGLYPHLVSPGVNVKTADLSAGGLIPNPYITVSGTSFAAPHLGGAAALLMSALPQIGPDQLESALTRSAADAGIAGPDNSYGHGIVDVVAAYAELVAGPACTDGDGDGYFAEPGCGTPLDCDDRNSTINPGAKEIARDRIDQDCNGFDFTLRVYQARYIGRLRAVRVLVTSQLKGDAQLSVQDLGPMHYERGMLWSGLFRQVPTKPSAITIVGREGSLTVQVAPYSRLSGLSRRPMRF